MTLAAALMTAPAASAAEASPAGEVGRALAASLVNVVYTPLKMTVAALGLVTGGLAGAATGGDTRVAYAIWVPTVGGSFAFRPGHFDGSEPFSFWGGQYSDEPSTAGAETDGSLIYEALYD
jgi:hypothetical protein